MKQIPLLLRFLMPYKVRLIGLSMYMLVMMVRVYMLSEKQSHSRLSTMRTSIGWIMHELFMRVPLKTCRL